MKRVIFVLILIFSASSRAVVQELNLQLKDEWKETKWPFSKNMVYDGPPALKDLGELKKQQLSQNFKTCFEMAQPVLSKHKNLEGWIWLTSSRCAFSYLESDVKFLRGALAFSKNLARRSDLLTQGPWRQQLYSSLLSLNMQMLGKVKTSQSFWEIANFLLERKEDLSRDDRAELFRAVASRSESDNKIDAAILYYQQSLELKDSRDVAARMEKLGARLNRKVMRNGELPDPLGDEVLAKIQQLFEKGNALQSVELGLEHLQRYPNNTKSQQIADRLINNYLQLFESNDEKRRALQDHYVASLSKGHFLRVAEWSRVLHRRGDYSGAHRLATKVIDNVAETSMGPTVIYIAGRTAHFLGQYAEALKYFEKLLKSHNSYSEREEVMYRVGLLYLRKQEWPEAISAFELLGSLFPDSRYALSSRYWAIRAKQKLPQTPSDLVEEIDRFIVDNQISYFGLRLLAEKNSGKIEWPAPKLSNKIEKNLQLSKAENEALRRMRELSQAGWFDEAQEEMKSVFTPSDAITKLLLAQEFRSAFSFPAAIKLWAEATDEDRTLREPAIVKLAYPLEFREEVMGQAKRYSLNPYLIWGLIRQESAFYPRATSTAQAMGLMQLIPPTAQEVARDLKIPNFVVSDTYLPEVNVQMGTYYISRMIKQFDGVVALGLAAYNAGPHRLKRYLSGRSYLSNYKSLLSDDPFVELWIDELPWLETHLYVKSIYRNILVYNLLDKGLVTVSAQQWGSLTNYAIE